MLKIQSKLSLTGQNFSFSTKSQAKRFQQNSHSYADIPLTKGLPDWNTSSAVLRHSTSLYTFPKNKRFQDSGDNFKHYLKLQIRSSLSKRSTSFGQGQRSKIPEVFRNNKNIEGINAPFYQIDDAVLRRNKSMTIKNGKTFGVSWDSYKNARTPQRNTVHSSQQTKGNPGPKYDVAISIGKEAKKASLHPRLKMFNQLAAESKIDHPSPQKYTINDSLTKKSCRTISFGSGSKYDFTSNPELSSIPGPIYNISGFCDKFVNQKMKNISLNWK